MQKISLKQVIFFILTVFVLKIAVADPMRDKEKKTHSFRNNEFQAVTVQN